MANVDYFLLATAAAYAVAFASGPLLILRSRCAFGAAAGAIGLLAACPFLIPYKEVQWRAVAAFISVALMFKIVDAVRHMRLSGSRITFGDYCRFLIPFPVLQVVLAQRWRRLPNGVSRRPEVPKLLVGAVGFAAGFLFLRLLHENPLLQSSFLLDHSVKLAVFLVAIESLSQSLNGLERLAGFDTKPVIQFCFLSRTVAEFWQRYNNRVHAWFYYNVFRPSGGRRAPIRAVVVTFFVSGLLHEVMFAIVTLRINGYQLAFFLLQIPGVLASGPLERWARRPGIGRKIAAHGFAVFWLAATSTFFFHGVNRIFPVFYASRPWLP